MIDPRELGSSCWIVPLDVVAVPRAVDRIAAMDTCWLVGAPDPARTPRVSRRILAVPAADRLNDANRPPVVAELELMPVPSAVADSITVAKRAI